MTDESRCPSCEGSGEEHGEHCSCCGGSGSINENQRRWLAVKNWRVPLSEMTTDELLGVAGPSPHDSYYWNRWLGEIRRRIGSPAKLEVGEKTLDAWDSLDSGTCDECGSDESQRPSGPCVRCALARADARWAKVLTWVAAQEEDCTGQWRGVGAKTAFAAVVECMCLLGELRGKP
jgi:hypothetical protein